MTGRLNLHALWRAPAWIALVLLAACRADLQAPPPPSAPTLATLLVQPVQVPDLQIWDGVVQAVHETTIAAQTSARVLELPFDAGDVFTQGAVLARLSDVEQQAGLSSAEAARFAARAQHLEAQTNWKRAQALFAQRADSRAQFDAATARRDATRADLDSAEAALRAARQQVDYTRVTAPYDGVVIRRLVHVGQAVQSGPPAPQPLLVIASLQALRVDAVVPQRSVAALRTAATATILLDDGRQLRATRITVLPYADPATHSFHVRLELPAGAESLYPGVVVKATFPTGTVPRLLIPASAVVRRGELRGVYVVGPDHTVSLRQLRLGQPDAGNVEVLAGLTSGERIAVDPDAAAQYLTALHAGETRR